MAACNSLVCNKMAEHYQSLLESGLFSDAVLVVGIKELRVHKLILSARSPVFAAMFTNESTKEAQENRVEIIDVDVEVMQLLVRYIYTGKVETAYLYAADLLVAADKYQMNCLKSICEQKLLYQITTESASDLLIFGDMYRTTELTSKRLDYITNNGTQVMATVGWEKIRVRADLLVMLYKRLHLKYSNLVSVNDLEIDSTNENDSAVDPNLKLQDNLWKSTDKQLLSQITIDSVSHLLIFSDKHFAIEFASKCLDYIIDNGSRVMATEGWKKIVVRADLLAKLFELLNLKYSNAIKVINEKEKQFEDELFRELLNGGVDALFSSFGTEGGEYPAVFGPNNYVL